MQEVVDQKTFRKTVAPNVLRLREARGWSQSELAEKLGISTVHLSRIENGHASPSAELMFTIADLFGISTDSLRQIS